MKKLIVANWKMNPSTYREAERLALEISQSTKKNEKVEVVACPPFVWLTEFSHKLKSVSWGAQDVFWENHGPYTGEVAPAMLRDANVRYVIIGHSERRAWLHETDDMVNKKVTAALKAGLRVVLCVGEPLEVRKRGTAHVLYYIRKQLAYAVKNIPSRLRGHIIVAYEPIWAVSTGVGIPCNPFEAERMVHACEAFLAIKEKFRNVIGIYGGSVNARDVKSYLDMKYINGVLVGGASLKAAEFKKIVRVALLSFELP